MVRASGESSCWRRGTADNARMRLFKPLSPRAEGILAALVTVSIWTSFIVVARATADPSRGGTLTPFDIAFARLLGAGICLLPLGWWLVRKDRAQGVRASSVFGFSPLPLRVTAGAGLCGGLLYALLAYNGFVFAPAGHASVLLPGSLPLWTALMAAVVLHTRITSARALGLLLIVAGDLMVGGSSLLHAFDGGRVWMGDLLFMAAAFSWSIYTVTARKHALDAVRATVAITAFAFFVYVPAYAVLLALRLVPGHFFGAPLHDIVFQMVFQGVGSVVVSGIAFTRMIQHFGPVRSTMMTAVVPGLSALAAVLFLGEPLYWNLSLGLMLVTLGIVFGVRSSAVPAGVPESAVVVVPGRAR